MNTIINTQILQKQMELINAERAVAVKALQEIEVLLFAPKHDYAAITGAYMVASAALEMLEWPREE